MPLNTSSELFSHPLVDQFLYHIFVEMPRNNKDIKNLPYEIIQSDFEELIDLKINVNEIHLATGERIVHICAILGQLNWLKGMEKSCEARNISLDLTLSDPEQGFTPLHLACFSRAFDMVQYLLKHNQYTAEKINLKSNAGFAAIHLAAAMSFYPQERETNLIPFIRCKADLQLKDNEGLTIADIPMNGILIFQSGYNYFGQNRLHNAAWSKYLDQTLSEIDLKSELNHPDKFGRTPLFYLTNSTNLKILEQLKPYTGKDIVNTENSSKRTPLFYAALFANTSAFEFLLTCGADLDKSDRNDMTPRQVAERYNRLNILALCTPQAEPLMLNFKRKRDKVEEQQKEEYQQTKTTAKKKSPLHS